MRDFADSITLSTTLRDIVGAIRGEPWLEVDDAEGKACVIARCARRQFPGYDIRVGFSTVSLFDPKTERLVAYYEATADQDRMFQYVHQFDYGLGDTGPARFTLRRNDQYLPKEDSHG